MPLPSTWSPTRFIPSNRPILGAEEIAAVTEVLESGMLTHKSGAGSFTLRFEEAFARFVGAKHAIAVNSGTAALHAALLAFDVKTGDEVIAPPFSFIATTNMVLLNGAKVVFADIAPDTYTLDPEKVKAAITPRTKAIMPVHLYGHPADMDPLKEMAEEHDIAIIEDACQAHGSKYRGRAVGTLGDVGCFSLYPSKVITTGEGGILTTNDDSLAERLRQIRTHGEIRPYEYLQLGHNYRMPELQSAIGQAQMKRLPEFLNQRRANATYLTKHLEDLEGIRLPTEAPWATHNWYLYTIRIPAPRNRDNIQKILFDSKIGAAIYYEVPLHLTPIYRRLFQYKEGLMPVSEQAAKEVLSLPVHPALTEEEREWTMQQSRQALAQPD
ncbi:MAG: DegT/DnrJ/EryC1/StrS family aminotransferase [Candidatus Thorarchaeota archaeon]